MLSLATLRPARALGFGFAACVIGGLLLGACESNKNYDERQRFVEANGFIDDEPCVGTCIEYDPPEPLAPRQCADAEAGLEFYGLWNFDGPVASYMYQYSDGSLEYRIPDAGWQPETAALERCSGEGGRVFHLEGGPFEAWGGGLGRTLIDDYSVVGSAPAPGGTIDKISWNCAAPERVAENGKPRTEQRCTGLDLSDWDGISFWAARGPDGQAAIRPMIGDWKGDDDWSYLQDVFGDPEPRQCYRAKECDCTDGKPCSWFSPDSDAGVTADLEGYYCYDPSFDPDPTATDTYDACGVTECRKHADTFEPNPSDTWTNVSVDPRFAESECVEYDYRTGLTDTLCYTPGVNRPPPESDQKCGDHWMSPVRLSREWKFYKVPFGDLLQQGWAKEFAHIDLSNVTTFRFTYGRGWIDYYIDDVSFYRKQCDAADEAE